jgi:hypothetical protein
MLLRYVYLAGLQMRLQRFRRDARAAREIQHRALLEKLKRHADSDFGREHGFAGIRTIEDFRRQVPVLTYEDHQPYISRVLAGEVGALFAPGTEILMFATTSGTTGEPKRLPITREMFREYKAGWRLWAAGVYGDHRGLLRRKTLQLTSDWQQSHSPSGIPCGQISGLAASTRPAIARFVFLPPAAVTRIHDYAAKHYASLRLALASPRIGMIITANPSTLIEFARRADAERESLIRDIHDGTLSCDVPAEVRAALRRTIVRKRPERARELERIIAEHGSLLPRYIWPKMLVLAVWTGGSVRIYLSHLERLYGETAIRDHGLSASEGRMTIPLSDSSSAGLLDFYHHFFEFIPVEEHQSASPTVLEPHELKVGQDYFIVLTTSGGLYRYDIHDVVRCVGFEGQAPYLEFLNKGKSFSNVTGEKLSEYQVSRAIEQAFVDLHIPVEAFTLAPMVHERPRYVLLVEPHAHHGLAADLAKRAQANLERINQEYAEKCASGRLLPVEVREVPAGTWNALRLERTRQRGNFEEYKHACLSHDLEFAKRMTRGRTDGAAGARGHHTGREAGLGQFSLNPS